MKLQEKINDSVDLENRSPLSTRLFTKISIMVSTIALLMFFGCAITYQIDHGIGLNIYASIYIPMAILFLAGLYLAICERLRAKYMSARIALIISALVFLSLVAIVVFELIVHGEIYIAPFNPPPPIKSVLS